MFFEHAVVRCVLGCTTAKAVPGILTVVEVSLIKPALCRCAAAIIRKDETGLEVGRTVTEELDWTAMKVKQM